MKSFEVTGSITISHTVNIDANTPEEATAIYEDEIVPSFDEELEQLGAIVEELMDVEALPVEILDGDVLEAE